MDKQDIKIKNVKSSYVLVLTKMNGENVGFIPYDIIELSRGIKTVSELSFTVNKYYGADNSLNVIYDELKVGRCIKLDDEETFVIHEITTSKNLVKTVRAFGKEKKLFKNNAEFEDITLTIKNPYEDIPDCYSLDELLYEDTGWKVGYVSDKVLYNANETILDVLQGNTVTVDMTSPKLRYQEDVSTNWYDYINNDISEQFECYPVFDSYNKLVHLYSDDELGERLQLFLSYDNYLKSHEVTTSIEDIITRMTVEGNDDLTIIEENPTGERYIENFSYFIEQEEMSKELIDALSEYDKATVVRTRQWYELREQKAEKEAIMQTKKIRLTQIYKKIQALKVVADSTSDEAFRAEQLEQIVELIDEQVPLEAEINTLTLEIKDLNTRIYVLNMLCKKKYATFLNNNEGDSGILIFNESLLNELKEFVFCDTYGNDCITNALDLYKIGLRQLSKNCKPTKTWSIDTVNFINKLIDNGFRQQWNGELALGDMIILQDDEGNIEPVYFIGYTQKFKKGEESIQLELSNIKENNDFSLTIGERLTLAKESYKIIKSSKSTINKVKRARVGLNYDKINKEIL